MSSKAVAYRTREHECVRTVAVQTDRLSSPLAHETQRLRDCFVHVVDDGPRLRAWYERSVVAVVAIGFDAAAHRFGKARIKLHRRQHQRRIDRAEEHARRRLGHGTVNAAENAVKQTEAAVANAAQKTDTVKLRRIIAGASMAGVPGFTLLKHLLGE